MSRENNKHVAKKCVHNKRRGECTICGGAQVCEHKRIRRCCKICGGSALCQHGVKKYGCSLCTIIESCKHGVMKYKCVVCKELPCTHGKRGLYCPSCRANICGHDISKSKCVLCRGKRVVIKCPHTSNVDRCVRCSGRLTCEHKKVKNDCIKCNPKCACVHQRIARSCGICLRDRGIIRAHGLKPTQPINQFGALLANPAQQSITTARPSAVCNIERVESRDTFAFNLLEESGSQICDDVFTQFTEEYIMPLHEDAFYAQDDREFSSDDINALCNI